MTTSTPRRQAGLFDDRAAADVLAAVGPVARRRCPTQRAAARAVGMRPAQRQARRLLRALADGGPATREQLCAATGIAEPAACGRLREMECPDRYRPAALAAPPLVAKCGKVKARSGNRVWRYAITSAGRAAIGRQRDGGGQGNGPSAAAIQATAAALRNRTDEAHYGTGCRAVRECAGCGAETDPVGPPAPHRLAPRCRRCGATAWRDYLAADNRGDG